MSALKGSQTGIIIIIIYFRLFIVANSKAILTTPPHKDKFAVTETKTKNNDFIAAL